MSYLFLKLGKFKKFKKNFRKRANPTKMFDKLSFKHN